MPFSPFPNAHLCQPFYPHVKYFSSSPFTSRSLDTNSIKMASERTPSIDIADSPQLPTELIWDIFSIRVKEDLEDHNNYNRHDAWHLAVVSHNSLVHAIKLVDKQQDMAEEKVIKLEANECTKNEEQHNHDSGGAASLPHLLREAAKFGKNSDMHDRRIREIVKPISRLSERLAKLEKSIGERTNTKPLCLLKERRTQRREIP